MNPTMDKDVQRFLKIVHSPQCREALLKTLEEIGELESFLAVLGDEKKL